MLKKNQLSKLYTYTKQTTTQMCVYEMLYYETLMTSFRNNVDYEKNVFNNSG